MVNSADNHSSVNKIFFISKGEMIMKKTNKGFSMVELIIVIAIMAILAGALAPALIKYINKSRLSADVSNGQQIASAIQEALTDETAYDSCKDAANFSDVSAWLNTVNGGNSFSAEVKSILGDVGKAKSKKDANGTAFPTNEAQKYFVKVEASKNLVEVYCGSTGNASWMVYPTVGAGFESK